jgi:Ca-activated chloride channel family protein
MANQLRWALVAVLCAAAPLAGRAQQTDPAAPPVFKAQSDLVVLQVNVFDGHSDAVPHLPQSAFQVLEDGKPQPITFFSDADVPVAVGLVIDNSTSMLTRRNMVLAGGRAFAESSHPEDEVFTIVFNEHVRSGLPADLAFTQSHPILEASLVRYPPGGLTAVYDAVIEGLSHLQGATHQKRVLVVLTDGDDNASEHSKQDMLHRAMRSEALIYTIYTGEFGPTHGDPDVLKKLATISGGAFYSPDTEADAVAAFKTIAENIRRGYSIGFVPAHGDKEYHRVKVLVRAPGYKHLSARARDGYSGSDSHAD